MGLIPVTHTTAQVSFGFQAGVISGMDGDDPYGLNKQWQAKSASINNSNSDATKFYNGAGGSSLLFHLTWEATPHFGVTLVYRNTDFKMSANHRTASSNSLGVQIKVNFVENTKKLVPFFQAEYMFMNSNHMSQETATSTSYPSQTQPAYVLNFNTNLGIGGDLGLEYKLGPSLAAVVVGGFHGVQATDGNENLSTLNYGNYVPPTHIDGVFFLQFTGGLKYYTGRSKKKKDF